MLRSLVRLAPQRTIPLAAGSSRMITGFDKWETIGPTAPTADPNEWWKTASKAVPQAAPLDQFSGRSIKTSHGPRAKTAGVFRRLQGLLSRTGVRKEIRMAEFHEKASDKRRRLDSERHRRRFQEMVRSRVQMVQMIKNRK